MVSDHVAIDMYILTTLLKFMNLYLKYIVHHILSILECGDTDFGIMPYSVNTTYINNG